MNNLSCNENGQAGSLTNMPKTPHELLQEHGLSSGPIYATGILKGHEAARMVADFKAQETIHAGHDRIIADAEVSGVSHLVDRLATFYHSEHVAKCQPWILDTPFEQWRDRQLAAKGIVL